MGRGIVRLDRGRNHCTGGLVLLWLFPEPRRKDQEMPQPRAMPGSNPAIPWIGAVCLTTLLLLRCASPALAADLPAQIGGAASPFVLPPDIPGLFIVALLLGFFGGAVAATSGACGGFLAVPALMGLGLRGVPAAGSELLALSVFGLLGGLDHFRAKKLHAKLALFLGLFSGFFLALAGATGGALTLPLLSGVMGLAAVPAAGADLLQAGLAAGLAAFFYSPAGLLTCTTAAGLLLGLLLGLLSGLRMARPVLRFINPPALKSFFLAVVLAVLGNRLLTLPAVLSRAGLLGLSPSLDELLHSAAGFLVFMVPLSFALWILIALFSNLGALRRGTGAKGIQGKALILSGVCTFLALTVLWAMAFVPVMGEEGLLDTADNLLLSRLKGQGLRYGDLAERLKSMNNADLRLTLTFPTPRQANAAAALITQYGYNVAPSGNRLEVPYLDAKAFARQALLDAEAVYARSGRAQAMGAGLPERETLFLLLHLSGTLAAELTRAKRTDAVALYARLQAEVLEPAYNLQTVRPQLGPIGWFWLAAMLAALLAMGLLWRAGGNFLLTGLGVSFLRDPVPVVAEAAAETPAPEAKKKPAPPAAPQPAKPAAAAKKTPEPETAPEAAPAEPQAQAAPEAAPQATKPAAKPGAKAPETPAPAAKPAAPQAKPQAQAKPAAAQPAQAKPATPQAKPAAQAAAQAQAKPAQPAPAKPATPQAKPTQQAPAKPQAAQAKPAAPQAKPQPKKPA